MSKETLISIAQRTGFSVSTVSRVLSGQAAKYRISEKTVALIAREAERCQLHAQPAGQRAAHQPYRHARSADPQHRQPLFRPYRQHHRPRSAGEGLQSHPDRHVGGRTQRTRGSPFAPVAQGRRHPDRPGGRRPRLSGSDRAPDARRLHRPPLREDLAALRSDRQPAGAAARRRSTSSTAATGGSSASRACATRSRRPTACGATGRRSKTTG